MVFSRIFLLRALHLLARRRNAVEANKGVEALGGAREHAAHAERKEAALAARVGCVAHARCVVGGAVVVGQLERQSI